MLYQNAAQIKFLLLITKTKNNKRGLALDKQKPTNPPIFRPKTSDQSGLKKSTRISLASDELSRNCRRREQIFFSAKDKSRIRLNNPKTIDGPRDRWETNVPALDHKAGGYRRLILDTSTNIEMIGIGHKTQIYNICSQ